MNYQELNKKIKAMDIDNVYLFTVKDEFMAARMLELLKRAVVGNDEASNYEVFGEDNKTLDTVIAACQSLSFLGDKKMVVMNVDSYLKKTDEMQKLYKYIEDPNASSVLVIVTSQDIKNTSQLGSLCGAAGSVVVFDKMNYASLAKWIGAKLTQANLKYDREAVELFIQKSGYLGKNSKWDLGFFSTELNKIINLKEVGDILTKQDVEDIVSTNEECDIFALCDGISDANTSKAQKELKLLFDAGTSEMLIISMLARHFRQGAKCFILSKGNETNASIAKKIGTYDFVVRKILSSSNHLTLPLCKWALEELEEIERGQKSGKIKAKEYLPVFLSKLMGKMNHAYTHQA